MAKALTVLVTAKSDKAARALASGLLANSLADSVNRVLQPRIVFNGERETQYNDIVLIAKVTEDKLPQLTDYVKVNLAVEVPEILLVDPSTGRVITASPSKQNPLGENLELSEVRPDSSISLGVAQTLSSLAAHYQDKGDLDLAEELFLKSIDFQEKALHIEKASDKPHTDDTTSFSRDEEQRLKNLSISESLIDPKFPFLATSYNALGSVYMKKQDFLKAIEYYNKGLATSQTYLTHNHNLIATSHSHVSVAYWVKGDWEYDISEEHIAKAIQLVERSPNPFHPDLALCYENIAFIYRIQGEFIKAIEWMRKTVQIYEETLDVVSPTLIRAYDNLGEMLRCNDQIEEAEAYHTKALTLIESLDEKRPLDLATVYFNFGLLYGVKVEWMKAIEYMETAMKIRQRELGDRHVETRSCYKRLSDLHLTMAFKIFDKEHGRKALEYQTRGRLE